MTLRYVQLRAFHYVAICGGFSRAAERLFLTQPAISDQVRKLEDEYDILLFKRHRKEIDLTPIGEKLLKITQRLFDTEGQALELISENKVVRMSNLRIVADSSQHILNVLSHFQRKHPNVGISINSGNSESVIKSLRGYEAEIGVVGEIPKSNEFDTILLNSTPITAFVATGHPLAKKDHISFHDLTKNLLIMREHGSKTRKKFEEVAKIAGFEYTHYIIAEGREAVREIVASGLGVGLVSIAEFSEDPRLVRVAIEGDQNMIIEESLICLKERRGSKLVNSFWEISKQLLQQS